MSLLKLTMLPILILTFTSFGVIEGRAGLFGSMFGFPETRRGRATPPVTTAPTVDLSAPQETIIIEEPNQDVSKVTHTEDDFLAEVLNDEQKIMEAIQSISNSISPEIPVNTYIQEVSNPQAVPDFLNPPPVPVSNAERPYSPRKVEDVMSQFGINMDRSQQKGQKLDSFPQLAGQFRQNSGSPLTDLISAGAQVNASDNSIRCIPKVMQIEEIVYEEGVKCTHSYQEKCHLTYITDYQSTSEEKCETTFKKNCHITFKPMPFNETVSVCNTPLVRQCGNDSVGPDICSTQYETNCETRYNSYEIEQDEPVCTMELMKKCKNVTVSIPRAKRQAETTTLPSEDVTESGSTDSPIEDTDGESLTFDQKCEEWPVQKCTLEKQLVKKVHPETACKNIPREVCVPNNCQMVQGDEVCFDDVRVQVQNVPQEECDLQPEETCHMESVLVPRLVPQPNCVKVPKEICVNTKTNPRRVKKPIVKEWCYRPSDLAATSGA